METRKLSELKATNPYLRMGTDVTELEKSIGTLGLIAPLVITPDNVILAGARRYQAMMNLGFTETQVLVVDKNELERELISIDENLVRKDLTKIEVESHLRRAKEIYEALNPTEEIVTKTEAEAAEASDGADLKVDKEVLPAQNFLNMVSEKTGLSPKQIHEAIQRDEKASPVVKEARINGELSLSQTNEIVKLKKEEQEAAIEHIKELPVREIKKFVKLAKVHGVEEAIEKTPNDPLMNEFLDMNSNLKKLIKKMKQVSLEGIEFSSFPDDTQKLFRQLIEMTEDNHFAHRGSIDMEMDSIHQ